MLLLLLLLPGCVSTNLISTQDFSYYVSEQKYLQYSCKKLMSYRQAFYNHTPANTKTIRRLTGIESYSQPLAQDIAQHLIDGHLNALQRAITTKQCQV